MAHDERERSARELEFIKKVRAITRKLPEVESIVDGHSHTTFRIGKKSFVIIGAGLDGQGSIFIKSDALTQAVLIKRGPYVRAPYIGQHGWVTLWSDAKVDWDEVAELIADAYQAAAPKRLRA